MHSINLTLISSHELIVTMRGNSSGSIKHNILIHMISAWVPNITNILVFDTF